jgi:hypothetical protein
VGHHRYLKYVLWAFIASPTILSTLGRAQTVTSIVVYRPYAFVRIVPPNGKTGSVFDKVISTIRAKTKIDEEDFQTLAYLREPAEKIMKRPPLQYVDGGGAKIKVVDVWDTRFAAPAEVHNVTIVLGYASDSVYSAVVGVKVAELTKDARDACDALGLSCSITEQFVERPALGNPKN